MLNKKPLLSNIPVIIISILCLIIASTTPTINGEFLFEDGDPLPSSTKESEQSESHFRKSSEADVTCAEDAGVTDKKSCEICEIKLQSVLDILTTEDEDELLEKTGHPRKELDENASDTKGDHLEKSSIDSIWSFLGFDSTDSEMENDETTSESQVAAKDSDHDGIPDDKDDDDDNDGIPDYLDDDDDGDGILDIFESDYSGESEASVLFYDFQAHEYASDDLQGVSPSTEESEKEVWKVDDELERSGEEVEESYETSKQSKEERQSEILDRKHDDDDDDDDATAEETNYDSDEGSQQTSEIDTDNDGIPDIYDEDDDNDGIPDYLDDDDDGDGISDLLEEFGDFTNPSEPSEPAAVDETTENSETSTPSFDFLDTDSASDEKTEESEPELDKNVAAEDLTDSDNDGIPDIYDDDDDNDGIPDYLDDDDDGDGILDFLEERFDGRIPEEYEGFTEFTKEEIFDFSYETESENIEFEPAEVETKREMIEETMSEEPENESSADEVVPKDSDLDGIPDDVDDDDDNDGIPDYLDDDDDGDGILDFLEEDYQAEQIDDVDETLEKIIHEEEQEEVREEIEQDSEAALKDSDNDGIPDIHDDDDDNDGVPDYLDDDDDGDGILDFLEKDEEETVISHNDYLHQFYSSSLEDGTTDDDTDEETDKSDSQETVRDDEVPVETLSDYESESTLDEIHKITGTQSGDSFEVEENIDVKDSDSDGIPDYLDEDDDNDGVPDYLDDDDDGDGILDIFEDEYSVAAGEPGIFYNFHDHNFDLEELTKEDEEEEEGGIRSDESRAMTDKTPEKEQKVGKGVFHDIRDITIDSTEAAEQEAPSESEDKSNDQEMESKTSDKRENDEETRFTGKNVDFLKDSDSDGIPDYIDDDDDNDGLPDYLDDDDDGDGILDFLEDDYEPSAVEPSSAAEEVESTEERSEDTDDKGASDFEGTPENEEIVDVHETPDDDKTVETEAELLEDDKVSNEENKVLLDSERKAAFVDAVKDSDLDGIPDYLDDDDDNDGIPDCIDDDDDGDGILDFLEDDYSPDTSANLDEESVDDEINVEESFESYKTSKLNEDELEADEAGGNSELTGGEQHDEDSTDDSKEESVSGLEDESEIPEEEKIENSSEKDSDDDGIPDYLDDDDDNDGIPDYLDADDDGDGILDFLEDDYVSEPVETEFLYIETNVREELAEEEPEKYDAEAKDSDSDGIPDDLDDDDDNDGIPDYLDDDDDGDGILDFLEDETEYLKTEETAEEEDKLEESVEVAFDSESDEVVDEPESKLAAEETKKEISEEGKNNEIDSDADGIPDSIDDDDDNDGIPDILDDDDDGDGIPDFLEIDYVEENLTGEFEYIDDKTTDILVEEDQEDVEENKDQKYLKDSDLDGIPDYLDDDDDNDGVPDYLDEDDDGNGILDFLEDDYVAEGLSTDEEVGGRIEEGIENEIYEEERDSSLEVSDAAELEEKPLSEEMEKSEEPSKVEEKQEETDFTFSIISKFISYKEEDSEQVEQIHKKVSFDSHKTTREFHSVPPSQAFTPEEQERFSSYDNPPEVINIDLTTDSDGDGIPDYRDEDDDDDGIPDQYDPEFKLPLIIQEHIVQPQEQTNTTVAENTVILSELIQLLTSSPEQDLDPAIKGIDSKQTCQLSGILKNIEKTVSQSHCEIENDEDVHSHLHPSPHHHHHQKQPDDHHHDHHHEEENLDLWTVIKLLVWGSDGVDDKER